MHSKCYGIHWGTGLRVEWGCCPDLALIPLVQLQCRQTTKPSDPKQKTFSNYITLMNDGEVATGVFRRHDRTQKRMALYKDASHFKQNTK
jgi:hypothetical protein